jgi:uncharacterized protein YegL
MLEQKPFGDDIGLAMNPEPRCPCILLLDISGSMRGQPIAALNTGIVAFKDELAADTLASKRVEVAIVSFGGEVRTVTEFTTVDAFSPPVLSPGGDTPMGTAINQAIDLLQSRKQAYKASGISYYRPWIFMVTDGGPTDEWKTAAARIKEGEGSKAFAFFAVAVEGANIGTLSQISVREPVNLSGIKFRDLFVWLSSSLKSVSRSQPGDEVPLPSPDGWAAI